ncbi:MAG: hypothetical protein K2H15_02105 [Muribaculaceae bacterium]|nr:hypothetical protein [Muribaculaceae bacterium]
MVTVTGSLFLCGFIGLQGLYALACLIIFIFQLDYIHLLATKEFFDMVVRFLMDLGTATHTNYICANIMVYIMPPVLILLTDYLMWCAAYLCKHMEIKAGPLANRLFSALGPLKRVLKTEFRQE